MDSVTSTAESKKTADTAALRETISITDNRTGKSYEIPITHGTIRAMDLRQIKVDANDFGMMSYDPAFNNTASCINRVSSPPRRTSHRDAAKRLDLARFASHLRSREHQEISRRLSLRRPSHGHD